MKTATLCFLVKEKEGKISDICLGFKKRGFGINRWNGFGGKVKEGETIEQAMERETEEESSVDIKEFHKVAIISFYFPYHLDREGQIVHIYLCKNWIGEVKESGEMKPQWFSIPEIPYNSMWWDDIYWLPKIISGKLLEASFVFDKDEKVEKQEIKEVESL